MADLNPHRECNRLCAVGRLSGGRGGGMPWVGATLCTFPAFSLVYTNAIVDNPRGGPHLLPFVAVYPGAYDGGSGISPISFLNPGGWMPWESFALRFLIFRTVVHRPLLLPLSPFGSRSDLTPPRGSPCRALFAGASEFFFPCA